MNNLELIALVVTVVNFFVVTSGVLACYLVFRGGISKTTQEIQERVIAALHEENELLQNRLKRVETENRRLNNTMLLVIATLKKTRNIALEIEGDLITFRSGDGAVQVSRLPDAQENN